ncbi:MAG: 5,10-methylenetetrahydromethanopterin reductase [Actinomycetota bacterium]|jgi:5,10-methylenetetrahydromethanopterin reductase|nr:5,10-methylenetetrahydromethanopterin reductase [Actinomycetota bacterium]MDQ1501052.1 5,10-methylenetetrahydromethanopterin reductase [Actinomycetota bacterium]
MDIGVMVGGNGLGGVLDAVREVADAGIGRAWVPQVFGVEALTAIAVAGREVPGIELGTAVVPTYPRHPLVLAGQALTTSAALGGARFHLGIGLSHQLVIEGMLGMKFEKPALHMREYLSALRPALDGQPVDVKGETLRATTIMGPITVDDAGPVPVLVAALGPAMLRVAGELADGTLTWMAAPQVIGARIAPSIAAAAEAAGRPRPRVGVGLPVAVTSDVDATLERAAAQFAIYGTLPSYKRLLDEAGLDGPAGVVIAGDEDEVASRIRALADVGATEFLASPVGSRAVRQETLRVLGALARESASA